MKKFEDLEYLVMAILCKTEAQLPPQTVKEARSLIDHREFGVACELLADQLYEEEAQITPDVYTLFEQAGLEMKLSKERWVFLKELVA